MEICSFLLRKIAASSIPPTFVTNDAADYSEKLEKVQRRFTKRLFGLSKMTYAARLQYLKLQSLERRRLNQDLIMCYKIVRGMVDVNLSDFFLHCLVLVLHVAIAIRLVFITVVSMLV